MKHYALVAALALAIPSAAEAGKSHHGGHSHRGHSHGGHYHGGHYARSYPSYGYRSYGYRSYGYPSYYSPYRYGGYGYGYGSGYGYYGGLPSVSFVYSSTPRSYASRSYYDSTASSLEVDVQRALKRRGDYSGSIDGDIGPGSRSAIRSYQANRGLAVTGRIDSALLRSLGI